MNDPTNAPKIPTPYALRQVRLTKVGWSYGSCNFCTTGNPNKEDVYLLQAHGSSLRVCAKCLHDLHLAAISELNKIHKP